MKYPDDFINKVIQGDCLDELKKLPSNYIDLIVTDPPYGYSFMGKDWDKAVPSVEVWQECLRVLKPGGFAFIMSAPRSDVLSRMIVRIEDAGFRVDFSPIYWTYASGFPKAMNIGKMVDKRAGVERDGKVSSNSRPNSNRGNGIAHGTYGGEWVEGAPATPQAKALDGSYGGFQPKPAVEVIIVAMKPLSEKTYVDQALKNGKGITWLDDCRIPTDEKLTGGVKAGAAQEGWERPFMKDPEAIARWEDQKAARQQFSQEMGRFPANLLVSDSALGEHSRFFDLDKHQTPHEEAFDLPQTSHSTESIPPTLPFLIVPKASKREKNEGVEDKNIHPTVKPLKLMSYLITLGSREGDIVLDPFVGSGTTCVAAKKLSRKYTGIEFEKEYFDIAKARIEAQSELGKDTLF